MGSVEHDVQCILPIHMQRYRAVGQKMNSFCSNILPSLPITTSIDGNAARVLMEYISLVPCFSLHFNFDFKTVLKEKDIQKFHGLEV